MTFWVEEVKILKNRMTDLIQNAPLVYMYISTFEKNIKLSVCLSVEDR